MMRRDPAVQSSAAPSLDQVAQHLVHAADRSEWVTVYRRAVAGGGSFMIECRVKGPGGKYVWTLWSGNPCTDSSPSNAAAVGSSVDNDINGSTATAPPTSGGFIGSVVDVSAYAADIEKRRLKQRKQQRVSAIEGLIQAQLEQKEQEERELRSAVLCKAVSAACRPLAAAGALDPAADVTAVIKTLPTDVHESFNECVIYVTRDLRLVYANNLLGIWVGSSMGAGGQKLLGQPVLQALPAPLASAVAQMAQAAMTMTPPAASSSSSSMGLTLDTSGRLSDVMTSLNARLTATGYLEVELAVPCKYLAPRTVMAVFASDVDSASSSSSGSKDPQGCVVIMYDITEKKSLSRPTRSISSSSIPNTANASPRNSLTGPGSGAAAASPDITSTSNRGSLMQPSALAKAGRSVSEVSLSNVADHVGLGLLVPASNSSDGSGSTPRAPHSGAPSSWTAPGDTASSLHTNPRMHDEMSVSSSTVGSPVMPLSNSIADRDQDRFTSGGGSTVHTPSIGGGPGLVYASESLHSTYGYGDRENSVGADADSGDEAELLPQEELMCQFTPEGNPVLCCVDRVDCYVTACVVRLTLLALMLYHRQAPCSLSTRRMLGCSTARQRPWWAPHSSHC